jgi:hypothetical protein
LVFPTECFASQITLQRQYGAALAPVQAASWVMSMNSFDYQEGTPGLQRRLSVMETEQVGLVAEPAGRRHMAKAGQLVIASN